MLAQLDARFKNDEKDIGDRACNRRPATTATRSGVLRQRFYNQFRAICTDVK